MSSKRASAVVKMNPNDMFVWLCHVENWPRFLDGLCDVQATGHRRYRWTVQYAKRERTVDVVTSVDVHRRRISWRHLSGPAFDGTIRVSPFRGARSQVDLLLDIEPQGFLEGVVDAFGTQGATGWMAERDLQRLCALVDSGAVAPAGAV